MAVIALAGAFSLMCLRFERSALSVSARFWKACAGCVRLHVMDNQQWSEDT
jgi:hypothetical protein